MTDEEIRRRIAARSLQVEGSESFIIEFLDTADAADMAAAYRDLGCEVNILANQCRLRVTPPVQDADRDSSGQ